MAIDPAIAAAPEIDSELLPPSLEFISKLRFERDAFIIAAHDAGLDWAASARALGLNTRAAYKKALYRARKRYTSSND